MTSRAHQAAAPTCSHAAIAGPASGSAAGCGPCRPSGLQAVKREKEGGKERSTKRFHTSGPASPPVCPTGTPAGPASTPATVQHVGEEEGSGPTDPDKEEEEEEGRGVVPWEEEGSGPTEPDNTVCNTSSPAPAAGPTSGPASTSATKKASQHLHVYKHKHSGKWEARVHKDGKHLGFHPTEEAAAAAVERYLRQRGADGLPSLHFMKKAKSSQHLYVSWHKHAGKWEARVRKDKMHLGFHRTVEAAAAAVERYFRQVVAEVFPDDTSLLRVQVRGRERGRMGGAGEEAGMTVEGKLHTHTHTHTHTPPPSLPPSLSLSLSPVPPATAGSPPPRTPCHLLLLPLYPDSSAASQHSGATRNAPDQGESAALNPGSG